MLIDAEPSSISGISSRPTTGIRLIVAKNITSVIRRTLFFILKAL